MSGRERIWVGLEGVAVGVVRKRHADEEMAVVDEGGIEEENAWKRLIKTKKVRMVMRARKRERERRMTRTSRHLFRHESQHWQHDPALYSDYY